LPRLASPSQSDKSLQRGLKACWGEGDLGQVDGFLVDGERQITHFILERGHLCGRREVTIPIGAVAKVETDAVTLSLSKEEVGALPSVRVHRWLD
jgi:hypothetical protein